MKEITDKIQASMLGPIQAKRLKKALSNITRLSHSHTEITNSLNNAGEVEESTFRISTIFGSSNSANSDTINNIKQKMDEVLSRVQYEVTPLNYMRVCEELAEAAKRVEEELPVDDKRKTIEELKADEKWHQDRRKEEEAESEIRDQKSRRFPYPKLVILRKEFYTMGGDYGDTNTSETYILANGNFERRDMNDFRSAIAKCPSLKLLSWKPHRVTGARVYNYELKANTDEMAFCSEDKKSCRDPYVGRNGCPGHKITYVVCYAYTDHCGHLPVYPELDEKKMVASLQDVASQSPSVEIRHNEVRNGLEVKFSGMPTPEQISILKQNSFRWARFAKLWYIKNYTPEKEAAIKTALIGQ